MDELDLPPEIPPIRLPDLATLAQQARASAMLAGAREVAEWLDGREVSVTNHLLGAADIAVALHTLGWTAHEFELRWDLAADLGFVSLDENEALPGQGLGDWPAGSDEMVVEIWDAAFEFVLTDAAWYGDGFDADTDPELSTAGTTVAFGLFLAGGFGVPRDELTLLVQEALGRRPDEHDPVPNLVALLSELGAVSVDDDGVVRLTPLALSGMRGRYKTMGVDVPLLPPVEEMSAGELLVAAPAMTEEEFVAEAQAWCALRTPEKAGEELLAAAASARAEARLLAVHLVKANDLATAQLWLSALELPEMRPYAKLELAHDEMDIADLAWLLTDTLATTGEVDEFSSAVPPGNEQEIFDAMWRLPHPNVKDVLTLIGESHSDKKIAKAARKAAFKARS